MTRRTLDVIFGDGGLVLAGLILVLGLVLQNQANFAKDYVHNQLAQQQITFTPANGLESQRERPVPEDHAGQQLVTGKQAECYANNYIAVHLGEVNNGKTYAETSITDGCRCDPRPERRARRSPPTGKALDGKVQTLFRGETLRGLLLTSYGFSIFGDRAQTAAYVATSSHSCCS